jgi:juvenile hormone acid methyltransferase
MPKLNPEIYIRADKIHREVAKDLLSRKSDLFQWNEDGNDALMDIGCGPGDITMDFLLPIMPKNSKVLIGADISQDLVDFCRENRKNEILKFYQLDMQGDFSGELNPDMQLESFNYITSFFTMNFVKDQK